MLMSVTSTMQLVHVWHSSFNLSISYTLALSLLALRLTDWLKEEHNLNYELAKPKPRHEFEEQMAVFRCQARWPITVAWFHTTSSTPTSSLSLSYTHPIPSQFVNNVSIGHKGIVHSNKKSHICFLTRREVDGQGKLEVNILWINKLKIKGLLFCVALLHVWSYFQVIWARNMPNWGTLTFRFFLVWKC